jgi:hypothetical protein
MLADAAADVMRYLDWHPPAIEERVAGQWARIEQLRHDLISRVAADERSYAQWKAEGEGVRQTLWASFTAKDDDEAIALLTESIDAIEARQVDAAKALARRLKKSERQRREVAKLAPAAIPAVEDVIRRSIALAEDEIREKLDFALFLRALRSEVSARRAGGRKIVAFDADAYLRSLAAE